MEFQEVCWSSWFKNPFKSNGYLKMNNQSKRHTSPSPNRRKKKIFRHHEGAVGMRERKRAGGGVRPWGAGGGVRPWGASGGVIGMVAGGVRSARWLAWWLAAAWGNGGWRCEIGTVVGMVVGGSLREWMVWGKSKVKVRERERWLL